MVQWLDNMELILNKYTVVSLKILMFICIYIVFSVSIFSSPECPVSRVRGQWTTPHLAKYSHNQPVGGDIHFELTWFGRWKNAEELHYIKFRPGF